MNPEPLVKAIISAMLLLEHGGSEQINPDTALRGLEDIAYQLLQLTENDRAELLTVLERVADATPDKPTARFIRSIPFSTGMSADPPPSP
ncbi:MAG: hypothetical protein ABSB76_26225 [Streptosporangiaceae bacterium]|jgi:hypothetical protein